MAFLVRLGLIPFGTEAGPPRAGDSKSSSVRRCPGVDGLLNEGLSDLTVTSKKEINQHLERQTEARRTHGFWLWRNGSQTRPIR